MAGTDPDRYTAHAYTGRHDRQYLKIAELANSELEAKIAATYGELPKLMPPFFCFTKPNTSKALLPTCPESCQTCTEQYLPQHLVDKPIYRKRVSQHSDKVAGLRAQQLVDQSRADLDCIRMQLQAYGDAIMKRWQRRSAEKRAAVVRKAMPEAYPQNFAHARLHYDNIRQLTGATTNNAKPDDYESMMNDRARKLVRDRPEEQRKLQLLPYLDVQTLSEDPMNLLAILHYRTDSKPDEWVLFDSEELRIPFNGKLATAMVFNPHCVIMYGPHYGRLFPWNKQSAHRQDIIGYPKAILILEAQQVLSNFLSKVVEIILETGVEDTPKGRTRWDTLAAADFRAQNSATTLTRRLPAYRAPPRYDIRAIAKMLGEKCNAMFDELRLLQTDPLYLRNHVRRMQDTAFNDQLEKEDQHPNVIAMVLGYVLWAEMFHATFCQAVWVLAMQSKYKDSIQLGKPLPAAYAVALVLLERHLKSMFEGQVVDLEQLQVRTKTFQHLHEFSNDGVAHLKASRESLLPTHPLLWNLQELKDNFRFSFRPTWYLGFIDHLVGGQANMEKVRIDDLLATHLSNMTVVDDIRASIRYHRPQPDIEGINGLLVNLEKTQPTITPPQGMYAGFTHKWPNSEKIWQPLKKLLDLPLPAAKMSRGSITQLRDLHDASGKFWDTVGKIIGSKLQGVSFAKETIMDPMFLLTFRHDKEHKDALAKEYAELEKLVREQEQEERERLALIPRAHKPADPLQTTWGVATRVPSVASQEALKRKIKTRPALESEAPTEGVEKMLAVVEIDDSGIILPVKAVSKDLFTRMLTSYSGTEGDVSFQDVAAAMVDAGCSVTPNGGSLVSFKDVKHSKGSVVYHRPHDDTVNPIMLRAMGRSLRRWFGWEADTFVVRE